MFKLIQISSLRRNNHVFPSVIYMPLYLMSRYSNNVVLSLLRPSSMTRVTRLASQTTSRARSTHRKPFYITPRFQKKNPASRENYASELYRVMMIPSLSRVGRTSCYQMIDYGRVHLILFQNIIYLCMKSWGKNDLFLTTWTHFYRLWHQKDSVIAGVTFFIH